MGGVILLVAYNLIDFHHIKGIFKTSKSETAVWVVTFIATLMLDLEFAIYIGVILSLVFYLQRTSKPRVVTIAPKPDAPKRKFFNVERENLDQCPQLSIIRIDGSLFFGAVNHISAFLSTLSQRNPTQNHLLIVASGMNFIDLAGAELLVQEAKRWRENGGDFYLCGLKKPVRELLKKGGYLEDIGEEKVFSSKQEALARVIPQLDHSVCGSCRKRVFSECEFLPVLPKKDEKHSEVL